VSVLNNKPNTCAHVRQVGRLQLECAMDMDIARGNSFYVLMDMF